MIGPRVYVASTLQNYDRVRRLQDRLVAAGATITYDWTRQCNGLPTAPATFNGGACTADDVEALRRYAVNELDGVLAADKLLVVLPGGRGTYFEFGVAYASGKQIVILDDGVAGGQKTSFNYLASVRLVASEDEALALLLGSD